MAQIKDRLLDASSAFLASTAVTPVVNAFIGAQDGPALNLGRYVNNAADISNDVICKVVEFPLWVDYMPDPKPFRQAIKSFFEVHTKIEGLQGGLTADFNETEIGAAGHRQFDLTKVTQQQSDITHSMIDKYGRPYQNMLTIWIRYGMSDPETQIPLIATIRDDVPDSLPNMYCATVLYFEPDRRRQTVKRAWLMTNVAPKSNGTWENRRDLNSAGTTTDLSIQFTGLQETGLGAIQFAQAELEKMNRSGLNPLTRKAYVTSIDSTVSSTAVGYFEDANAQAAKQL